MPARLTPESQLLELIFDQRAVEFNELSRAYNPLRVLGVEHYEIRHANALAWLLTPSGSHGLGDAFARQFLKIACDQEAGDSGTATLSAIAAGGLEAVHIRREVSTSDLERLAKSEAEDAIDGTPDADDSDDSMTAVRARRGLLDVLIQGEDWVVAIEAKVRGRQHSGQLDRYAGSLAKGAPSMHRLHLFLTNDLSDLAPEPWRAVTWDRLVSEPLRLILGRLPATRQGEAQIAFLRSLLDIIDEHCMPPKGRREDLLDGLAEDYAPLLNSIQGRRKGGNLSEKERDLVAQNADLVKKLAQRFRAPNVLRRPMLESLIQADERLVLAKGAKGYVRFVMRDWLRHTWVIGARCKGQSVDYGVVCEIENSRDKGIQFKLQIRFLIGDDSHRPKRESLLRSIRAAIQTHPELAQRFPRAMQEQDKMFFSIYSSPWVSPPNADNRAYVEALLQGEYMRSVEAISGFLAQI